MKFKSIAVIAVLVLVVASLSIAGCTFSTTPSATPSATSSATPSTATHNATLEKFLAAFKNRAYADKNYSIKAWELTWINSTSARLEMTEKQNATSTNYTFNMVMAFTAFPTAQDATNYLNTMNKTGYSLDSSECSNSSSGGAYQDATGHVPTTCKDYKKTEGDPNSFVTYREYHIFQLDNIIMEATLRGFE